MKIFLIRHLKTKGNMQKRYIGRTDEPLHEQAGAGLLNSYPDTEVVYTSPMLRCIQTAELIYGKTRLITMEQLREIDFGDFEGKNYEELKANPDYISFLNRNGDGIIPNGEALPAFKKRCGAGFLQIIHEMIAAGNESAAVICHGGTIMAILEQFDVQQQDFYSYMVKNGEGFATEFDVNQNVFTRIQRLG